MLLKIRTRNRFRRAYCRAIGHDPVIDRSETTRGTTVETEYCRRCGHVIRWGEVANV